MGLYTIPTADLFDTLVKTLGVGYDYMTLCFYFIGSGLGACNALTFSPITDLTGGLGKSFLHPVQACFGYLQWVTVFLRYSISFEAAQVCYTLFLPYE